ncbi:nucleotidyltransferase domain-containing protein [Candidatus Pacearchaeota archaeon]|nr:nucleotidyltransferase domain-containing protein [Candidatus Pacearchaeota archaeon]
MFILNEESKIAASFLEKPWKKLTYSEIRKLSGKKSKSYIYRTLSHLMNDNVIDTEQIGNSLLYGLKLYLLQTQSYCGLLSESIAWDSSHIPESIIEKIADRIRKITPFFVFIVTGSYAKRTENKRSDIDIVILCDDTVKPQTIIAEIKLESDLSIPKVHPFVFKRKEFLEMLINKEFNYGKEIARNNLLFFGSNIYFNILNDAIEHGFKG